MASDLKLLKPRGNYFKKCSGAGKRASAAKKTAPDADRAPISWDPIHDLDTIAAEGRPIRYGVRAPRTLSETNRVTPIGSGPHFQAMRRKESLVGQVVAINVLLIVAVLFAASAAAGLNLTINDQRMRFGAIAISIVLLLIVNMILLRRRFSPLEELIERIEQVDPAQPNTQFVVPRT